MAKLYKGTDRARKFYDKQGWTEQNGRLEDLNLFGVREDGPIRRALHAKDFASIDCVFDSINQPLDFVELGCGGNPAVRFRRFWSHYTGIDFSSQGLSVSSQKLTTLNIPHTLIESDVTCIEVENNRYDALYCAHVLYHMILRKGKLRPFLKLCAFLSLTA